MSIRNHTAMAALLASLTACTMEPAHADAWHPGQQIPDAGIRDQPTRPKPTPALTLSHRFDAEGTQYTAQDVEEGFLPVPPGYKRFGGGLALDHSSNGRNGGDNLQTGGNGGGNNGCGNGNSGPNGGKDCDKPPKPPNPEPPTPPVPDVPGPLPVLGAGVAFGWARRMRRRMGK